MYTLVLLAAATTGEAVPAHHPAPPYLPVVHSPAPSTFSGFSCPPAGSTSMAGLGFGSCYGCCGGGGCLGGAGIALGMPGPMLAPGLPVLPLPPIPLPPDKLEPEDKKEKESQVRTGVAQLLVSLPADARLYVNGQETKATSNQRLFETPALVAGETYAYTLRAELPVEGRMVVLTRRVLVRFEEQAQARFEDPRPVAVARER